LAELDGVGDFDVVALGEEVLVEGVVAGAGFESYLGLGQIGFELRAQLVVEGCGLAFSDDIAESISYCICGGGLVDVKANKMFLGVHVAYLLVLYLMQHETAQELSCHLFFFY